MTLHVPMFMQPTGTDPTIGYTAQEWRQFTVAMLASGAAGFEGGEGITVLGPVASGAMTGGYAVTQRGAGANFSVDVAAGHAFVLGDDVTSQGVYFVWNDATVNVPCPSPPASGSRAHRLVLQVQDKLANGVWTGYTSAFLVRQDTGGGTPVQGNTEITLALITETAGDVSIQNVAIVDYRRAVGEITAQKTSSTATSRTSTTSVADDPDLQLWGLANNAMYQVTGFIKYDGGSGANEGDISWAFRQSASGSGSYADTHQNISGQFGWATSSAWTDARNAQTVGTGSPLAIMLDGTVFAGGTPPNNYLVFQWAQNSSKSTATRILQGSWLRARRVN